MQGDPGKVIVSPSKTFTIFNNSTTLLPAKAPDVILLAWPSKRLQPGHREALLLLSAGNPNITTFRGCCQLTWKAWCG